MHCTNLLKQWLWPIFKLLCRRLIVWPDFSFSKNQANYRFHLCELRVLKRICMRQIKRVRENHFIHLHDEGWTISIVDGLEII